MLRVDFVLAFKLVNLRLHVHLFDLSYCYDNKLTSQHFITVDHQPKNLCLAVDPITPNVSCSYRNTKIIIWLFSIHNFLVWFFFLHVPIYSNVRVYIAFVYSIHHIDGILFSFFVYDILGRISFVYWGRELLRRWWWWLRHGRCIGCLIYWHKW